MSRSRGWAMTLNNYTEEQVEKLRKWFEQECTYAVIGREVGEEGTRHLQISAEFRNMKSLAVIKKVIKELHCEHRKGTKEQSANYCKEDGDFIEIGVLKNEQGKRTDIMIVKEAVKEGKSMREIIDMTNSYQALRHAEVLKKYIRLPKDWKPEVHWFYGSTGTGKSLRAYEMSDPTDRWVSMDSLKWWDGYDGHADVIIDDFRASDCTMKYLLRVLDRYEMTVEVKGGSTQLRARRIFITAPKHPKKMYNNIDGNMDNAIEQLLRRIDYIREFKGQVCWCCSKLCYAGELCCGSDVNDEEFIDC